jgi:hypothetical protein
MKKLAILNIKIVPKMMKSKTQFPLELLILLKLSEVNPACQIAR